MGLDFYLNELSFIALIFFEKHIQRQIRATTLSVYILSLCVCGILVYTEYGQWIVKWTSIISFNLLHTCTVHKLIKEPSIELASILLGEPYHFIRLKCSAIDLPDRITCHSEF